jgi:hypothetical protein
MGECGCGEMNIIDSFLVGNKVLAVDLYRGCPYCGADIGIRLHIFTKKEAKFWDIQPKEEFKPDKTEMNLRELFWFDMDKFKKAILDIEKKDDPKEYDSLKDWFDEYDYEIFQKVCEGSKRGAGE